MTTPVFFQGTLPIEDGGTPVRVHQGIPLTADNRVPISLGGVESYSLNGVPFDSAGRCVVADNGDESRLVIGSTPYFLRSDGEVEGFYQGLPFGEVGGSVGPDFPEAIADGSIAFGKPLVLETTGIVSEVDTQTTPRGIVSKTNLGLTSSIGLNATLVFDESQETIGAVYIDAGELKVKTYDCTGGQDPVLIGEYTVATDSATIQGAFEVSYDAYADANIVMYKTFNGSTSVAKFRTLRQMLKTGGIVLSSIRTLDTQAGGANFTNFVAITNLLNGNVAIFWNNSSDGDIPFYIYTNSNSGTRSVQRFVPNSTGQDLPLSGYWDPYNTGRYVLLWRSTSTTECNINSMNAAAYNTTPSWGGIDDDNIPTSSAVARYIDQVGAAYAYWTNRDTTTLYLSNITRSGNNVDWGGRNTITSNIDIREFGGVVQEVDGKTYFASVTPDFDDSSNIYWTVTEILSATSRSFRVVNAEIDTGNWLSVSGRELNGFPYVSYLDGSNNWVITRLQLAELVESDKQFYIGIAQSAAADGETVFYATSGLLAEGLSGLTQGVTYFVDDNGDLTTTDTGVEAGVAQSSTTLLVS